MRYDITHPFAMQIAVMFNGVYQQRVIACDDVAGWVTRYVEPQRIERGDWVMETIYGDVEVYVNARYAASFVATMFAAPQPPKLLLGYNNGK